MISAYASYRKKEGIQTQYGREGSPILKRCVSFWCKIDHFRGNQHSLLSKNLDFSFLCSTYHKIFGNKFLKLCFCLITLQVTREINFKYLFTLKTYLKFTFKKIRQNIWRILNQSCFFFGDILYMTADVALFSILACLPFSSAHKISLNWLLTVRCLLMSCFLVA